MGLQTLFLLSLWQAVVIVVIFVAATRARRAVLNQRLSRKWKTKPIKRISISFIERILEVRHLCSSGKFFDNYKKKFDIEATHTLHSTFLGNTIILTKSPKNIKWVLSKDFDNWNLGSRPSAFGPLLGNGIFVAEGERWKHLREMLKPQFMREQISHVNMLEPHIETLIQLVETLKGKAFDIQHLFHKFTMDASTQFLFGESVSSLKFELAGQDFDPDEIKRKVEFDQSLLYVQEYIFFRVLFFQLKWVWNSFKFRRSIENVHNFTMDIVNETVKRKKKGQNQLLYVFLDELMKITKDPTILRDESLNIMLAGRSTTASLLLSIFYELARNPRVWKRLRSEVINMFGSGKTSSDLSILSFETLKKCLYLKFVLNETLRLYPPVMLNLRRAVRDTYLPEGGGPQGQDPCLINKGDYVALHIYSMHRLEDVYGQDAAVYNPDRWETISSKVGSAFIPFGTGPRVCLGQQYALTEALYVTVRLLQQFSNISSYNSEVYPPSKRITATLQFSEGVKIALY